MSKRWWVAIWVAATLCGCRVDAYDNGDTKLSYLTTEMVDMHTVAAQQVDYAITDGQQRLTFATPFACSWASKPDTLYRALLYYDSRDESPKPLSATPAWVLIPMATEKTYPTDPVKLESAWVSANKRYLNLRLGLMTGQDGDSTKQSIGLVQRRIVAHASGITTHYLELSHDQNKVPQYYTTSIFTSIPATQFSAGDTIHLSINTYQGPIEKQWVW